MFDDKHPLFGTYQLARRITVGIVGGSVLLVGIAMIVLPGPAFVVIPAGLGILSIEFAWARIWLKKVKSKAGQLARNFQHQNGNLGKPKKPRDGYSIGRSNMSSRTNRTGGEPNDSTLS